MAVLGAGCSGLQQSPLQRQVGESLQRMGRSATRGLTNPSGRLTFLDQRPILVDLRNAIRRLPATLRIDTPPFPDYHAPVRMAEAGSAWEPLGIVSRALTRLFP